MARQPPVSKTFYLDAFALRQWEKTAHGTRIDYDQQAFVDRVEECFQQDFALQDGYAPFCKHIFVPNFVGAKVGALPITNENRHLLKSGYVARRPEELSVLSRWFSQGEVTPPVARYLDVILYSREQILQEVADLPSGEKPEVPNVPWGIISIKAQDENHETPMQPITMMRNAVGREHGGSGVDIDRRAYDAAVAYWDSHAVIL